MTRITGLASVFALVVGLSQAAGQTTFVEGFETGTNEGGWAYGTGNEVIEDAGGNPGSYLHDPFVDSYAPRPRTTWGIESVFTGDYRTAGVTSVGIDLILHYVDFSAKGRPLSVLLISDNGTPGNFNDDWAFYKIGDANVPLVGQEWLSYDFDIPSDSPVPPAGWESIQFGPGSPADPDFNDVITDVTRLEFFYGDPTMFFIYQAWNVGLDNPRITYGGTGDIAIVSSDPPDGAIDARQPFNPDGSGPAGWDSIVLTFDGDATGLIPADFSVSVSPDGDAPTVIDVTTEGATATVLLSQIIPELACTTITHDDSGTSATIAYLPADVNNDRISNANDILALVNALNGVGEPLAVYQMDINRSGVANASDILRVIDLLNGANPYFNYLGVTLDCE